MKKTQVKELEKLGHSLGRANRFLNTHKVQGFVEAVIGEDGKPTAVPVLYRAVVFAMPEGFRLRNDVIQGIIRELKCDWQTAKFHAYRISAVDVIGNKEDFPEIFPPEKKPEEQAAIDASAKEAVDKVIEETFKEPQPVDPAAEQTCPSA